MPKPPSGGSARPSLSAEKPGLINLSCNIQCHSVCFVTLRPSRDLRHSLILVSVILGKQMASYLPLIKELGFSVEFIDRFAHQTLDPLFVR